MPLLTEMFIAEGMRDKFFRDQAEAEFDSILRNLPRAQIEVIVADDNSAALMSNEVGYYIERVTETLDLLVVFTTKANDRPRGHYYERDSLSGSDRPMIALYHEEDPKNLIKRKLLASRGGLKNTIEAFEKVLLKRENTFTHEYIHHLDKMRMGPHRQNPPPTQDDSPDDKQRKWGEYYNSPLELNAYAQSMAAAIEKNVKKNPQNWPMDSQEFYFRAMSFIEKNYPLAWSYFNEDSKRRVQKRVMQMWLDLRGSG